MNLIVKMQFGAHLYGTADAGSDLDYRGVFMPSRKEILLGKIPKSRVLSSGPRLTKNRPGDKDEEFYSLHHFIQMACEGEVAALDMLHAPESFWIVQSETWSRIVAERRRFYSKRLTAFAAYARRQTAKYGVKGSRLHAAAQVLALLERQDPKERLAQIWEELPRGEHYRDQGRDPQGQRLYQVCGKTFQESVAIGQVASVLRQFYHQYGRRAELAAQNREIDWKAVSHALRAAYQTHEIVTRGTLHFPLAKASYLKEVKAGRLDYAREVAPALERAVDEAEQAVKRSTLPEKADRAFWEDFICEAVERSLQPR